MKRLSLSWRAVRDELGGEQEPKRSGMALIFALLVLGILFPITAAFTYKADLIGSIQSNAKKEVVAYYHARSAMEVARLIIKSQNVFDNMKNALAGIMPNIKKQNMELWTFACEFANAFCSGKLKLMGMEFFNLQGVPGIGLKDGGTCQCRAFPEDGRININRVDSLADKQQMFSELYAALLSKREEKQTDPREIDRDIADLALRIVDVADTDTQKSDFQNGRFVQSSGAEPPSKISGNDPKNAKYDTLSELQLVPEIDSQLYCEAAKELTPYSTEKLNINTAKLHVLRRLVCNNTTNYEEACYSLNSVLGGPIVDYAMMCMDICRTLRRELMSPGFGNVNDFLTFFERMPAEWQPRLAINKATLGQKIGVKSRVIRVETTGGHKNTFKSLTSVIDTGTGNYVYWREH